MADAEQLALLKSGVDAWNQWRAKNLRAKVDLSGAVLSPSRLRLLRGADLRVANLSRANLSGATLIGANLGWANLSRARLLHANLSGADLTGAVFKEADLRGANLRKAKRGAADFTDAVFGELPPEMKLPRPANAEELAVETLPRTAAEPGPDAGTLPRASEMGQDDES